MERRIIYITRGLPACGKSTYSKKYILDHDKTKRVNRDDLRTMLNGYVLTWENQTLVLKVEENLFQTILLSGYNIISDNMYLRAEEMKNLSNFIYEFEAKYSDYFIEVVIVDFTDVSVELCIERDMQRTRPTTEIVIRKLYNTFLDENMDFMNAYVELTSRKQK